MVEVQIDDRAERRWYGAKTVYSHGVRHGRPCYEERVVVLQARDFDEAIRLAEEEAERYAASLEGRTYLGFVNVYEMDDDEPADGAEVYSIMRSLDVTSEELLNRYYDDGSFHTQ